VAFIRPDIAESYVCAEPAGAPFVPSFYSNCPPKFLPDSLP